MKKLLTFLLLFALILPAGASWSVESTGQAVEEVWEEPQAALLGEGEFTVGGVTYTVIGSNALVVGYTADIPRVCTIPSQVEGYNVTEMSQGALYNCSQITSLTLPDTLKRIGSRALAGCTGLTAVTVPASVTHIATTALRDCTGLTEITVEAGNQGGYYAVDGVLFNQDHELIQYPAGNRRTGYTVPEGTTKIANDSAIGIAALEEVTVPGSVRSIGINVFSRCGNLHTVHFAQGLEEIDGGAFAESAITRVELPSGMTEISNNAFRNNPVEAYVMEDDPEGRYYAQDGVLFDRQGVMETLFDDDLGDWVTETGLMLMYYPQKSTRSSYAVPDGVKGIGASAFWNCEAITSLTLPQGLLYIGFTAITGCEMTSLTIPDSVVYIGDAAFQGCDAITQLRLGAGVTEIRYGLVSGCTSLKDIYISSGVETIEEFALSGCGSLQAVHVDAENRYFRDVDGVLYNKTGTELILCPAKATNFVIPATVTAMTDGAFSACAELSTFQVQEGSENVFVRNDVLFLRNGGDVSLVAYPPLKKNATYTVPADVTRIAGYAFSSNKFLKKLNTANVTTVGESGIGSGVALQELVLPALEEAGDTALWGFAGTQVELPATLRTLGNQVLDYRRDLEFISFAGMTPPKIGHLLAYNKCPSLRYVYVPTGTQVAYKNALVGKVAPGAMIVEGKYIPASQVKTQIKELTQSSPVEEVNAAAANVIRMLEVEKKTLPNKDLARADQLFQTAHAGTLAVEVDQREVTATTLTVQGLALASGLVEEQGQDGTVSGTVSLTAQTGTPEKEGDLMVLDFSFAVNDVPAQPKSPVVITAAIPASMQGKKFHVVHRNGTEESDVDYQVSGDTVTFRAESFSSYVFVAGAGTPTPEATLHGAVSYDADRAGTLYLAGFVDNKLTSVKSWPVTAGSGELAFTPKAGVTYKVFVIDGNCAPVGTGDTVCW